jgi:hypothetical protein
MSLARRALEMIGPDAVPLNEPVAAAVAHTHSQKGRKQKKMIKQTAWLITYKEAEKSLLSMKWKKAMNTQIQTLKESETWEEIEKNKVPASAQILSGRWVFSEKDSEDGKVQKARWVVRGFKEKATDWDDLMTVTVKT